MVIDYDKHKQAIEQLYEDRLTVESAEPELVRDEFGDTKMTYKTVYQDEPCRISNMQAKGQYGQMVVALEKGAKLFTSPDIDIQDGSTVKVTRGDKTFIYRVCILQTHFKSHNEYQLWAEEVTL